MSRQGNRKTSHVDDGLFELKKGEKKLYTLLVTPKMFCPFIEARFRN
jgi:hypothetical protein